MVKMTTYEQNKLLEENSNWRYWKESQKASIQIGGRFSRKRSRFLQISTMHTVASIISSAIPDTAKKADTR